MKNKRLAKQKKVRDVAKLFLNSKPNIALFAKPARWGYLQIQDNIIDCKRPNALTLCCAPIKVMVVFIIMMALQICTKSFCKGSSQKVSDIKFLKN